MRTLRRGWGATLVATLVVLGTTACGDDDGGGNNNQNVVPDAGVDAGPDAATGASLTILVRAYSATDATYVPTAGVGVAFQAPGGTVTDAETDAEGKATFTDIDWSAGKGAVTTYLASYLAVSAVDLDATRVEALEEAPGTIGFFLDPITADPVEKLLPAHTLERSAPDHRDRQRCGPPPASAVRRR